MNSDKNKQLLWNLLYKNKCFANCKNFQFDKIKQLFDIQILKIDQSSNSTVLEKNKLFIQTFIKQLNSIEESSIEMPYKREDIINNRKEELLDHFNKKNDEFNEFQPARPKDIDFSDSVKDTPINLLERVSQLNHERTTDNPILLQILTTLKEISKNQQQILKSLDPIPIKNEIIQSEPDLINMNINE